MGCRSREDTELKPERTKLCEDLVDRDCLRCLLTVPKNHLALGDKTLRPGAVTLVTVKGWGSLIPKPTGRLQLQLWAVPRSSSFLRLHKSCNTSKAKGSSDPHKC